MITIGNNILPTVGFTKSDGVGDVDGVINLDVQYLDEVIEVFYKDQTVSVDGVHYKVLGYSNTYGGKLAVYLTRKGLKV